MRAAGLWDFLFKLEIAWPWQADLSEFLESALQSDFRAIRVRNQSVSFSVEAISNVTTLPAEEGQPLTNAELPINAREWEAVFEGGALAFDDEANGWEIEKAVTPWKEWLYIFRQRIELGEDNSRMEHCVVCAAFTALMRGARYNWAEELQRRIREEVETKQNMRPVPLLCAGYLGSLSHYSIVVSPSSAFRSVPPFLRRFRELSLSPSPSRRDALVLSPEPPEIREESIELHGDFVGMAGPSEEFVVLPRLLPVSPPFLDYSQVLDTTTELLALKQELEEVKALCQRKDEEIELVREEEILARQSNLDLQRELTKERRTREEVELEKKEWHSKCEAVFTEFTRVMSEKVRVERENVALAKEKEEWKSLKERQERAIVSKSRENQELKRQISQGLSDEQQRVQALQQVQELKASGDQQKMELEESKKRIESLKAGIWAIDSVSPPFSSLFKNFEFQRDIFFLVHSLRMKQKLSVSEFDRLWEEALADGLENLLAEILARGDLKVSDLFRAF